MLEKHDLHHEVPDHHDSIHHLQLNDNHSARSLDASHKVDHEVHRIETGGEITTDDYLNERKKAAQT